MWTQERVERAILVTSLVFIAAESFLTYLDWSKKAIEPNEKDKEPRTSAVPTTINSFDANATQAVPTTINSIDANSTQEETNYISEDESEEWSKYVPYAPPLPPTKTRPRHVEFPPPIEIPNYDDEPSQEAVDLYNLLSHIASDTLRKQAIVHTTFHCLYCANRNTSLRGSFYKCTECVNVEICENCEHDHAHDKTHLLYKINTPLSYTILNSVTLSGKQIPWISEANIAYLKNHPLPMSPSFSQIEDMKKALNYEMSTAEIGGLYDQFQCLVDTDVTNSRSLYKLFGAISRESLEQLLITTRYSSSSSRYLTDFILDMYDLDLDGVTSFSDFIQGTHLVIHSSFDEKLDFFMSEIIKQASASKTTTRNIVRNLFFSYIDLTKRTFADALNLQTISADIEQNKKDEFEREKELDAANPNHLTNPIYLPGSSSISANTFEKEQDSLLWHNRSEIDSWTTYDPVSQAPETEAEIAVLWDMSIEALLKDIFQDSDGITANIAFKTRIRKNPQLRGAIQAFFEAGII